MTEKRDSLRISVVTPTFQRPDEVRDLIANLKEQSLLPFELVLIDGTPSEDRETALVVEELSKSSPFPIRYSKWQRGTAVQRNRGIDLAAGDFIAFIDDDVRLDSDFLEKIGDVFERDSAITIGGVVGYRRTSHFRLEDRLRWRWYKRLRLLTTFEPGRYDFETGYPINANMQPPFEGVREVDFMTTACAVWRRQVFESGLRFDEFFTDYGVLEDAHFSLRAGRNWTLLQCGDATCVELSANGGRVDARKIGFKSVVNYYFVFQDICGPLSLEQKFRFWRFQLFELLRIGSSFLRRGRMSDLENLIGRLRGFVSVGVGNAFK